jgi:hypothetical protein
MGMMLVAPPAKISPPDRRSISSGMSSEANSTAGATF